MKNIYTIVVVFSLLFLNGSMAQPSSENYNAKPIGEIAVEIQPNPVSNSLKISFEHNKKKTFTVSVANRAGQIVIEPYEITPYQKNYQHEIPVEELKSGVYDLKIEDTENAATANEQFVVR